MKVVVTGGAGCLGHAVIDQLTEPGGAVQASEVRSFDRRASGRPPRDGLVELLGDVRSISDLRAAVRGADLVLHCAAAVDWGQLSEAALEEINLGGTRRVLEASKAEGVRAMVHTSTLDVLFTGEPIHDADETRPYPARHPNAYCRTKAEAEEFVLAGNAAGFKTAVIRPCVIFGERDPFHVPALLERARRGALFRVGDGRARAEFTYVGNVAHALLVAGRSLLSDGRAAGNVYFVTDGGAGNFFDFLGPFVEAGGGRMPGPFFRIPSAPLRFIGSILEGFARASQPFFQFRPTLTRFAVDFICNDFTVKTDRAARELGYAPRYSRAEAIERTIEWHRANRPRGVHRQS